jgi:hypothetical protein
MTRSDFSRAWDRFKSGGALAGDGDGGGCPRSGSTCTANAKGETESLAQIGPGHYRLRLPLSQPTLDPTMGIK